MSARDGDGTPPAAGHGGLMARFDRILMPRIRYRYDNEVGANFVEDLIRARLATVLTIVFVISTTLYVLSTWQSWESGGRMLVYVPVIGCYFFLIYLIRRSESPELPCFMMNLLIILFTWMTLPIGAGTLTFISSVTQLMPIVSTVLVGPRAGVFSWLSGLSWIVIIHFVETRKLYEFPLKIEPANLGFFMATRMSILVTLAMVLGWMVHLMHSKQVDKLRRLTEELHRAKQEAQDGKDIRKRFLANVSTQLRGPLDDIIGATQQLANPTAAVTTTNGKSGALHVQASAEHLRALVLDMAEIAKLEGNDIQLEQSSFNLSETIYKAMVDLHETAAKAGVHLSHDLQNIPSAATYVGDPARILQCLTHLVKNAIKFTSTGGEVTVVMSSALEPRRDSDRSPHHRVTVKVADTGRGIAAHLQPSLFEPFEGASRAGQESGVGRGRGLGLCKARAVVRMLGGELSFTSAVNVGTTFTFDFVVRERKPVGPNKLTRLNQRVLLIDDVGGASPSCHVTRQLVELGCTVRAVEAVEEVAADFMREASNTDTLMINVVTFKRGPDAAKAAFLSKLPAVVRGKSGTLRVVLLYPPGVSHVPVALRDAIILTKPLRSEDVTRALQSTPTTATPSTPVPAARQRPGSPHSPTTATAAPVAVAPPTPSPPLPVSSAPASATGSLAGTPPAPNTSAAAQVGSQTEPLPVRPVPDSDLRVLCVDDNETNLHVASRLLKVVKLGCDTAKDGLEAVDAFERALNEGAPYNFVLMDLHMPRCDGHEATVRIRELMKSRGIPFTSVCIVALTADALESTRLRCLSEGFNSFLTKPAQINKLKEEVASARKMLQSSAP